MKKIHKSIFVLVIIAFIIVLYFYFLKKRDADIIVLESAAEDHKVKPVDPGGIVLPNSDSYIYEQIMASKKHISVHHIDILPDPEEPIEINFERNDESTTFNSIDEILENISFYEDSFLDKSDHQDVDKISFEQDSLQKNSEIQANDLGDSYIDQNTKLNITKSYLDIHKFDSSKELLYDDANGYKIQLSMSKTEDDARNIWTKIRLKNFNILEDANLIIKKIHKNDHIYFLVMSGPYDNQYKAKLACRSLKRNNQNCIITK